MNPDPRPRARTSHSGIRRDNDPNIWAKAMLGSEGGKLCMPALVNPVALMLRTAGPLAATTARKSGRSDGHVGAVVDVSAELEASGAAA